MQMTDQAATLPTLYEYGFIFSSSCMHAFCSEPKVVWVPPPRRLGGVICLVGWFVLAYFQAWLIVGFVLEFGTTTMTILAPLVSSETIVVRR